MDHCGDERLWRGIRGGLRDETVEEKVGDTFIYLSDACGYVGCFGQSLRRCFMFMR